MKRIGKYKMRTIFVLMICIWMAGGIPILGAPVESKEKVSLGGMNDRADGGITQLEYIKNRIHVKYDTTGMKEGYYTSFFYVNGSYQVEKDDVIALHLSTKSSLNLNINLFGENDEVVKKFQDGEVAFIKEDGEEIYEILSVEYGTFKIQSNFSGMIYFPLSQLSNLDRTINQLGFILVQKENVHSQIEISSDISIQTNDNVNQVLKKTCFIEGEERIEIPDEGEYSYDYSIVFKDNKEHIEGKETEEHNVLFELQNDVMGIEIDEQGILFVSSEAKPQELVIYARIDNRVRCRKKVFIEESWKMKETDSAVKDFIIPNVSEVKEITKSTWLADRRIRGILTGGMVVYVLFYIVQIRKK